MFLYPLHPAVNCTVSQLGPYVIASAKEETHTLPSTVPSVFRPTITTHHCLVVTVDFEIPLNPDDETTPSAKVLEKALQVVIGSEACKDVYSVDDRRVYYISHPLCLNEANIVVYLEQDALGVCHLVLVINGVFYRHPCLA